MATAAVAEVLFSIPAESRAYEIQPVEVAGDWMRVRVSIPPTYCELDPSPPEVREGWIEWRTADRGPLLWYFTRGC